MKLELRGITKTFGSFVANDAIDLVVEPGEIHSLLGENGAGKSTLMNVLYGLYRPDGGQIVIDGEPVAFSDPGDAMDAGIGMVHQHFMLVPVFTVAENMVLGHEPTRGGLLDIAAARTLVREISARFGFDLDPDALVEDLPVGAQQQVEIIKALSRRAGCWCWTTHRRAHRTNRRADSDHAAAAGRGHLDHSSPTSSARSGGLDRITVIRRGGWWARRIPPPIRPSSPR